ncbi:MAG: nitroreductase [Desulfobacteraceae bacterium]|nr:nitroreductase [Desulfobacteraceae bacterium]
MDLIRAMEERRSVRAFLDRPVEREKLERLLQLATRAPSAINLQPWEITVVFGEEKKRLSRVLVKRMRERNISCAPGARNRLPEVFLERQRGLLDVILPNLPDEASFEDFINEGSCNFYGAPSAVIIVIDEVFSSVRLTDIGILLGYLLLGAHAMGLGTCPIGLITAFDDDIRELLNIPDQKQVVIGVGMGYADPEDPVNRARSNRVPLGDVVKWRG